LQLFDTYVFNFLISTSSIGQVQYADTQYLMNHIFCFSSGCQSTALTVATKTTAQSISLNTWLQTLPHHLRQLSQLTTVTEILFFDRYRRLSATDTDSIIYRP